MRNFVLHNRGTRFVNTLNAQDKINNFSAHVLHMFTNDTAKG